MARRNRKTRYRRLLRVPLLVLVAAIVLLACFALANAILGVSSPRLGQNTSAIDPYALQPQLCRDAGVVPTSIPAGVNGTNGANLILGTNGVDAITGRGGNDCLVGGNGNDSLNGGNGNNDVCIGGPGNNDTFNRCEHQYQ
jgi:Ca2+-binding RTX toxin-like protein